MITLDATALSTAASGARGVTLLVDLDFLTGGVQHYTVWPHNLIVGATTYVGLGGICNIAPIQSSEDTKTDKLVLSLSIVNAAMIAASIGNAKEYRGRAVTISVQLIDETFIPSGAPVAYWTGLMDKIGITRNSTKLADGSNGGSIELECARSGMSRARNAEGLRLTHAQQQQRFPGDLGLEYVALLLEKPQLWLSKAFQEV